MPRYLLVQITAMNPYNPDPDPEYLRQILDVRIASRAYAAAITTILTRRNASAYGNVGKVLDAIHMAMATALRFIDVAQVWEMADTFDLPNPPPPH